VHVALLRGINVGGKNKLPMKDLVAIFEAAGCTDVKTYIASGNVVFNAKSVTTLGAKISAAIEKKLKLKIPVVLRTHKELMDAVKHNPFDDDVFVMFLADKPTKKAVASLDPKRSPPDEFVVIGREIYLNLPNSAAKTKLTNAYFDRALDTVSTSRNLRTVNKLIELSA
jgi:uncharacterized protein (DUF1697 family)